MTAETTAPTTVDAETMQAVETAARAARDTVADLASVPDRQLDHALRAMADHLGRRADEVLAANAEDMRAARAGGVLAGLTIRNPSRTKCVEATPQGSYCALEGTPLGTSAASQPGARA